MRVKVNAAGLRQILQVESGPLVRQVAGRVEGSISAAVGQVDGHGVTINRHDNDAATGSRYRAALVLTHPSAKGRQAANDAAQAALKIAGS